MLTPEQVSFLERYVASRAVPQVSAPDSANASMKGLEALESRVQAVLAAFPSMKIDLNQAVAQAKAGSATALAKVRVLLDEAEARGNDAGIGTASISIVRLSKSRLEWRDLHTSALKAVDTLKDNIRKAYGTDERIVARIDGGLSRLDQAVAGLNEELTEQLDAVLSETDGGARARIASNVEKIARRFRDKTMQDPVLSTIDGTVFLPGLAVIGPMTDKLHEIIDALRQIQTEPAY